MSGTIRLRALIAFLIIAIGLTWPLTANLADTTPSTFADSRLTVWILAWDAHVLKTDPTDLYQAPIFSPERDTLAYTDPHLTFGIFAAPIIWVTGNPFLAHNILFLAAFVFSAYAMFLLSFELVKSWEAAFVAALAFAFAPYWFGSQQGLTLLKLVAAGWLPLFILYLFRWIHSGRRSNLVALGVVFVLATLASWYWPAFLITAATLMLIPVWRSVAIRLRRHWLDLGIAALAVAVVIIPFARPYLRLQASDPTFRRSLEDTATFSANGFSYVSAPARNLLYGGITEPIRNKRHVYEFSLFPGIVALICGAAGLLSRTRERAENRLVMGAVIALVGAVVLSLGAAPSGFRRYMPWAFLNAHVVIFRALRVAARFHIVTLFALSILVAFGVRALVRRFPRRPVWGYVGGLLILEAAALPLVLGPAPRPPAIYQILRDRPGAVLEIPTLFFSPDQMFILFERPSDVDFMLYQIGTWKPLVNGIAGFTPPGYFEFTQTISHLPDPSSMAAIRSRGVRTLIVHTGSLVNTPWRELPINLRSTPGVRLLDSRGGVAIYDVDQAANLRLS